MAEALTPMMQQYQRIKREIPADALLLFRLGDFYEMFFEDAKVGAEILGLTLTKRNEVPMCGMPHHSSEGYMAKLIQAGKRVAVCDQLSEPKPGQVVERGVTQILSPGCVPSIEMTQPKENRYLAAIVRKGEDFGVAFLDVTTGDFRMTEIQGWKATQDEIDRLQPREILLAEGETLKWNDDTISAICTNVEGWILEPEHGKLVLLEHFKVQSLDGFGCRGMSWGVGAAGALIYYVTRTLRNSGAHILSLKTYSAANHLILDAVTQRNLELVGRASTASSDTSLLKAIDYTVTAAGGRELRNWILHPLRAKDEIEARQKLIKAWMGDVAQLDDFRAQLREVRDLERLIGRIAQGSGNARDLRALALSLKQLPAIKQTLEQLRNPLASSLKTELVELPTVIQLIEKSIVEEPSLSIKEGGIIAAGYHAELDELHAAMRDGKSWVADLQAREQERTGIKSLKVRFNQVFGYYIEVTQSNLNQVPQDYIRKQTMTNAERFITPELKEMEAKILGAEERARKLEYELFLQIRDEVAKSTAVIQSTARALASLDVLAGLAYLARLRDYVCPEINEDGVLKMIDGRHPVLEMSMSGERFVPNDAHLDHQNNRLVILTGPNMAGKSTYIRQVALIALLGHMGSFVPARAANICILDRIFTRIGANDDLSRGQSTFMVEMNETANILNHATRNSLVILDEIGRGTSTFDGLSIAWSVAEYLDSKVQAKTLFATHYHELTELATISDTVKNFNVAVREWQDQIIFLRKIVAGGADKSYGIQVARLAGLPKSVLERAKEILRNLEENELDATGKPSMANGGKRSQPASRVNSRSGSVPPQLDLFKMVDRSV